MLLRFTTTILFLHVLFSCSKTGCTDVNSDNYSSGATKNDNSCLYRYIYNTSITLPYSLYSNLNSKVYIKFFKKYDNNVQYESNIVSTTYNSIFEFNDQFYFTNETWTMQVWVIDEESNEENVISSDFNPFDIQPNASQNLIRFNTEKNQNLYQVSVFYTLK